MNNPFCFMGIMRGNYQKSAAVISGRTSSVVKCENQPGIQETINTTHKVYHLSILDAANLYMDFKNGIKVPTHLKRDISKKHLESIEHNIRLFLEVLKQKGIHPNDLSISELNDFHVGMFADYLDENFSNGSWNLRVSILKSFVEYTIKKHFLTMQNPFVGFKRIKFEKTIESISEDEFNSVLEAIKTKDPIERLNGKTKGKNRYRPYLEDAFKLALYTGLRREELLTLEWKDVVHSTSDKKYLIVTDNLKVQRITGKKCPPKFIPIHSKLEAFLHSMDWTNNKGSTNYIIQPNRTSTVETMMVICTRAFSHFYRQAFPSQPYKSLGVLRKTYLSYLYREAEENMIKLSSHGNMRTLETHYLDKRLIAKGAKMEMF